MFIFHGLCCKWQTIRPSPPYNGNFHTQYSCSWWWVISWVLCTTDRDTDSTPSPISRSNSIKICYNFATWNSRTVAVTNSTTHSFYIRSTGLYVDGNNTMRESSNNQATWAMHDDVIKWKHFLRYWPFVRGIHRSPVNSPHKGQWRGALMFFFVLCLKTVQ